MAVLWCCHSDVSNKPFSNLCCLFVHTVKDTSISGMICELRHSHLMFVATQLYCADGICYCLLPPNCIVLMEFVTGAYSYCVSCDRENERRGHAEWLPPVRQWFLLYWCSFNDSWCILVLILPISHIISCYILSTSRVENMCTTQFSFPSLTKCRACPSTIHISQALPRDESTHACHWVIPELMHTS
jgi:hypothetical protein